MLTLPTLSVDLNASHSQLWAKKGRRILPTPAIIDAQSVKASPTAPRGSQSYDGGRRIKGRKRHVATDTPGPLLVLIGTAAGVQESAGGRRVLASLAERWPTVTKTRVDAEYSNAAVKHGAAASPAEPGNTSTQNARGSLNRYRTPSGPAEGALLPRAATPRRPARWPAARPTPLFGSLTPYYRGIETRNEFDYSRFGHRLAAPAAAAGAPDV
ncbi:transposase [Kitasatospora sp. NPDC001539]|uniref:transposase n=1 Tax=Kitasatospora sp. NPDC001539 TaxID=3154384 RepID=UPI0033217146